MRIKFQDPTIINELTEDLKPPILSRLEKLLASREKVMQEQKTVTSRITEYEARITGLRAEIEVLRESGSKAALDGGDPLTASAQIREIETEITDLEGWIEELEKKLMALGFERLTTEKASFDIFNEVVLHKNQYWNEEANASLEWVSKLDSCWVHAVRKAWQDIMGETVPLGIGRKIDQLRYRIKLDFSRCKFKREGQGTL
jgi:DNA repair exonuclease SbcCD ATPase subunit